MSRKSQQIRASRRMKEARKWARNDNAPRVTGSRGVAKESGIGVEFKPSVRRLRPA